MDPRVAAARALVAAPLLVTLAHNVANTRAEESNKLKSDDPEKLSARVISTLRQEWQHVGEIVISDAVLHPYVMHLRASEVPHDYQFTPTMPAGYEKSLNEKILLFETAVGAFWDEWRANNGELAALVGLAETNMIYEKRGVYYWRESDKYRVGVIEYLTDSSGKKYMMQ